MVVMRDKHSKLYGGILNQKATQLVLNLTKRRIKLSAFMKGHREFQLVIYGLLSHSDSIGDFLSKNGYFLQRPDYVDDSVTYHNPQWLVAPGKKAKHVWEAIERDSSPGTPLRDTEKHKLNELLDSATGPTNFKRVPASDFLVTELKE